jgi:hypothetical protein
MTHDTTDIIVDPWLSIAELDNGIEVLIWRDHGIFLHGPELELEELNGSHSRRHVNVDNLNLTADQARHMARALLHAADQLDAPEVSNDGRPKLRLVVDDQ